LAQVVRHLANRGGVSDPNVLVGLETPDDAAIYRLDDRTALVQTVDFFTPVVDDAYQWGSIAVANAVSDVYAMGGKPLLGLNLVGWPKDLDMNLLGQVLAGGADKAAEAGLAVVGGHTVDDPEPKFGMAVTGLVDPDKVMTLANARPGMLVVLTKPLASGIVATALKRDTVEAGLLAAAVANMAALNDGAAAAAAEIGVRAATDVTGFGLIGHLRGMAAGSGLSVTLWADQVPVLEGVRDLAERGFVPGGTENNEAYFSRFTDFEPAVDPITRICLFDAQTSGGLLLAVEAGSEDALVQALRRHSTAVQAIIGRFGQGPTGTVEVRSSR
jgi:selenide, water dikinase